MGFGFEILVILLLVLLNGLFRHGFLLAPALARRAAAVVLEGAVFPEVMDEGHRQ